MNNLQLDEKEPIQFYHFSYLIAASHISSASRRSCHQLSWWIGEESLHQLDVGLGHDDDLQ